MVPFKDSVSFVFDRLPPSLNEQYIKTRRRPGQKSGMALSPDAKAFEKHVKDVVGSNVFELEGFPVGDKEVVYRLDILLYFERLENPGWFERWKRGKNRGERKAQTRYKKLDIDNRVKFLQDRLCAAIGIPGDEQVFTGRQDKMQSADPRCEVVLTVTNRDDYFPEEDHGQDQGGT